MAVELMTVVLFSKHVSAIISGFITNCFIYLNVSENKNFVNIKFLYFFKTHYISMYVYIYLYSRQLNWQHIFLNI